MCSGEDGQPVIIDKEKLTAEQRADYDKGWKDNAFNRYASDMISLHRSLPDIRDEEYVVVVFISCCKAITIDFTLFVLALP